MGDVTGDGVADLVVAAPEADSIDNARSNAGEAYVISGAAGISGVVDAHGRVLARLGLNQVGKIDTVLPKPLPRGTIFSEIGNWQVLILALIVAISCILVSRVR